MFGGRVQEGGEEEVGSVFGSVGSSVVLFFLNFEFVNSLKNFFFGEEDTASVGLRRDFEFSGVVLFEIESNSGMVVSFDLWFDGDDFLGDVLRFFGLS